VTASEPTIRLGIADHDLNTALIDGAVKAEGFTLDIAHSADDGAIHSQLREGKIDACEYSFGALMAGQAQEVPYVAIPAFPNRKFRLSYIFVNSAAGIHSPKDLEGRRVGILGWTNTAGIWARGALQHYYNVDLTRIQWCSAQVAPDGLLPGITIEQIPRGKLEEMLLAGELDAVIQADVPRSIKRNDPRVRRLFVDYKHEEQAYYRETGIFPISHVVTFQREFVARHPAAPVALLQAFRRSRDEAFRRIEDQEVLSMSWATALLEEQRELMGEHYWAYNVEDNRRPLEAMAQFAHEQGVTPHHVSVDSLFVSETASLPGF
jgi:4,5-dihydroxyphthalate decarboxylase